MNKSYLLRSLGMVIMISVFLQACGPINTFEKNVPILGHEWESSFKPTITFDITDTASLYNVFLVILHRNAYGYNNIWIRGTVQEPADTAMRTQQYDLKLANDEKGWYGKGMDDIFEHRIQITPPHSPERLSAGTYRFKLENIMREDPLKNVMNVGIRLEKAQ